MFDKAEPQCSDTLSFISNYIQPFNMIFQKMQDI